MSWEFVPPVANVGTRIPVTWTPGAYAAAGTTKVTIHGSSGATFTSAGAGAESIFISKNGAPPVEVISSGGEVALSDWVTLINTTFGFVDVAAEDVLLGRLRFGATDRIQVTAYGGSGGPDAAFNVIGLPIMPRDVAFGAQEFVQVESSLSSQHISDVVMIPEAANYCSVYVKPLEGANLVWDIKFMVAFSNGTEGLPPGGDVDGVASVFSLVPEPVVLPYSSVTEDRILKSDILRLRNVVAGSIVGMPLEYRIPAGYDRLYIYPLMSTGLDGGPAPGPYPPALTATVNFGSR